MSDDYENFIKKENFKANRRKQERELERAYKNLRESQKETRSHSEKQNLQRQRLLAQREIFDEKNKNSLIAAEAQAIGTLEAENVRAEKELQIKKMDVEAQARMLKAEQDFYPIKQEMDFIDEVKRSNLRSREYASQRDIDRQMERSLENARHGNRMDQITEEMKKNLMERAQKHRFNKDLETHQTNEKIRFAYAMAQVKKEFGEMTEEEALKFIQDHKDEWSEKIDK